MERLLSQLPMCAHDGSVHYPLSVLLLSAIISNHYHYHHASCTCLVLVLLMLELFLSCQFSNVCHAKRKKKAYSTTVPTSENVLICCLSAYHTFV